MDTAGSSISDVELHLPLNDIVPGCVDFNGRPSVRSKSGCWRSSSFVVGVQMAERISYYGISSNMVNYLTGVLGQSTAAAAANLNAWYGTAALTPILAAFLADWCLGRHRMVILSSLLYILGLGCLTLSAALNSFNSTYCESVANKLPCSLPLHQIIFFFISFYLVALAQGGYTPCLQAFGADQFDVEDEKESQGQGSFFNWCNWFGTFGILIALVFVNYIQENLSWELGFGIPTIVMCFALVAFLAGTMTYRFNENRDGKLPFVEQDKNGQSHLAPQPNEQILPQECSHFEFLGVALIAPGDGSMEDKVVHRASSVDVQVILKLIPIWSTSLGYSIIFAQPATLFTKQGATLDRHILANFQIPAASLQLWIVISIMVFIPIYDRILVPIVKATTKNPSGLPMLQRMGIGLCISLLSMTIAAMVESKRLATAREYGLVDTPQAVIPMSVWWLAPQYMLSGTADVFTLIGLQEFFYDQFPGELKSVGIAMNLSVLGIGSFLSSFLVYVVDRVTRGNGGDGWLSDNLNRGHLDYFYWVLAGIGAFSLALYIYFARSYVYSNRRITVGN